MLLIDLSDVYFALPVKKRFFISGQYKVVGFLMRKLGYLILRHHCNDFRFPCGRWLGKMVDDGSTERLLVAQLLPQHSDTYGTNHGFGLNQVLIVDIFL